MNEKATIRVVFVLVVLIPLLWIGGSWYFDPIRGTSSVYQNQSALPMDERARIVGDRSDITVVTGMNSLFANSKAIYAFSPNGKLLYHDSSSVYGDVDPLSGNRVLYTTHDAAGESQDDCSRKCTWQYIKRVNLSSGNKTTIWKYNTPGHSNSNWHDVDRVGTNRYLIGDLVDDSAYIINTTSGIRPWGWSAQSEYPITEAGPFPTDWTHLNDVERLHDGRIMLSLRNQDQVVFIHPEKGLQESWTLGCEDCHDILYEQHNPDYITEQHGGPAILVADSENNRAIEYQRVNGSWKQSWVWTDEQMDWPRDVDRLPNGHTLITDSHGKRLLEVGEGGGIVWQAKIINGYDAERLGTGDESHGGPSAVRAGLESKGTNTARKGPSSAIANEQEWEKIPSITKYWHAMQWMFPPWIEMMDLLWVLVELPILGAWVYVEYLWSDLTLQWPLTAS